MVVVIASNSHAHIGEKGWGGVGGVRRNLREEGNADYREIVQLRQQHVAPCVKGVDWGLGTRSLGMLEEFWAGIPVEVIKQASVVLCL